MSTRCPPSRLSWGISWSWVDARTSRIGIERPLYTYDRALQRGQLRDRLNRFTLEVAFDGTTEPVYLRNSGGLETTYCEGRTILCAPAVNEDRKTAWDAIAIEVNDHWVSVDAILPNELVRAAIEADRLPGCSGFTVEEAEPALPNGGRADLLLRSPEETPTIVEVKSNTYVQEGISKIPDRPTSRGRRHLRELSELTAEGAVDCLVVFVIQRPDAQRLSRSGRPIRISPSGLPMLPTPAFGYTPDDTLC